ncbi:hypothetical protein [Kribbella solani]|uniref:tRNA nuclease CdiA C-terminal domain-containing protein n=1 Tax=Kribbella solani TaxID=236067 RepID=A0A841DP18_9ACTN|nr:hypothetical protein [Kribbella solani]MBB5977208.1 hypothetical protein [Kribbella solani]
MPSELQRVARGLVDCFDEIPRVVEHLQRTAVRCRENAQLALSASQGQATVAAQQLDAAARACEAAAHYLSMAPPKARGWAEGLVGAAGPATNRPAANSADRNKATGGTGDAPTRDSQGRTKRLTATYEDLELEEDDEPPVITVARKAFEKYRKAHEKDNEEDDDDRRENEDLLEFEITITEHDEIKYEERNQKEEDQRESRLTTDHALTPDPALTKAIQTLLDSMAKTTPEQWNQATLTITPTHLQATFDYADNPPLAPITTEIHPSDLKTPEALDFDPAFDSRPLELRFSPGVFDPVGSFNPEERAIADRLAEEGWRVDARLADHSQDRVANPDSMVRKASDVAGVVFEFKTPKSASSNAIKRNIHEATEQAGEHSEILIDGRPVGLTEDVAWRSYRRACGQPGGIVADHVHVILGDGRLITYTKEH